MSPTSNDSPTSSQGTGLHDLALRHATYRRHGWWTGEAVIARYEGVARRRPGDPAVIDSRGRRFTHAGLWEEAGRMAAEIKSLEVRGGDVVLIDLPNWSEWKLAFVAAMRAGAIPATLPVTTDHDTLTHMASLTGARLLITADRFGGSATGEMAMAVAGACPHRLDVMLIAGDGTRTSHAGDGKPPASADTCPPWADHIMFTSSTTGLPKAVLHGSDSLGAQHSGFAARFGLGPDDAIFMASPLGHAVGAIHGVRLSMWSGAPLILQERWDPERAVAMVAEHRCTFTAAATPFLKDLVDLPWTKATPKLGHMRTFLCGGAQVPPALMEKAIDQFPDTFVSVLWGMTEGGHTTCLPGDPLEKRLRTAGVGLPGLEVATLDPDGHPVPAGTDGEIVLRGPTVFQGYFGQADLYQSLLTADGFFHTGDIGCLDANGYLLVTGRLKDLIIRGGVNISPVKLEDTLSTHPHIKAVAVVGAPDDRLGERICAVIEVNGARVPSLAELQAYAVAKGLPKRLHPETMRVIDAMPRTAAGKIRKNVVRSRLDQLAGGAE